MTDYNNLNNNQEPVANPVTGATGAGNPTPEASAVPQNNTQQTWAQQAPPPAAPTPPPINDNTPPPVGGYQPPQYAQNYIPNQQTYKPPITSYPPVGYTGKSRLAAALLALMVGCFGVHNFYLGFKSKATIQLIVCIVGSLFCGLGIVVVEIWAIVEGINLLIGNEEHRYDGYGMPLKD